MAKQISDQFTRDAFEVPKRGRPRDPNAKSAKQRMREMRERRNRDVKFFVDVRDVVRHQREKCYSTVGEAFDAYVATFLSDIDLESMQ